MNTIRLTAAQAMVRYVENQFNTGGERIIEGVWAIFGHGNVAGLGEALYSVRDSLPTYRGHNEQTMAHAAIAYAKQPKRKRAMAVTSSIGPGATNMVTAAALACVNRFPALLIPGDVFAARGGKGVQVIVVDTDPYPSTKAGGTWWDVAVPEVSKRKEVNDARADYETKVKERNQT